MIHHIPYNLEVSIRKQYVYTYNRFNLIVILHYIISQTLQCDFNNFYE